tara:strand:+ start:1186 stop:1524 length:339 start_codon:yes stop_codon:yes gene_type:complete
MSLRQIVLDKISGLLESGESHHFEAFGESRGMQAKLVDGKIASWEMWGRGGQECHIYPEPVSSMYAALCVVKSLVDEKDNDPRYAAHSEEFYDFWNSPEGREMCAEAKRKDD